MFLIQPTGGPGEGIFPSSLDCTMTFRSGTAVKGGVYQSDFNNADGDVDNNTPGSSDTTGDNSGFNNATGATAGGVLDQDTGTPTALARENVYVCATVLPVADQRSKFRMFGLIDAATDGSVTIGSALTVTANEVMAIAVTNGHHVFGWAMETDDATPEAETWFNGITGWGVVTV